MILPAAFPVNAFSQLDLTIENSRPKLNALAATFNGKLVSSAEPSEVVDVRVRASDADGDPVKLLWVVNQGDGVLSSNSGPAGQISPISLGASSGVGHKVGSSKQPRIANLRARPDCEIRR